MIANIFYMLPLSYALCMNFSVSFLQELHEVGIVIMPILSRKLKLEMLH